MRRKSGRRQKKTLPASHQILGHTFTGTSDSGISSTGGITGQNVIDALLYGTARMSPEVREAAEYLIEHSLYDISYSEKKLPTGYTSYLYSFDVPFIFNCPYDSYADYTDMFHEFGHWLAGYYHGSDALYGVIDYDLSELQSQGMEVMFLQFYEDLFGDDAEILRADAFKLSIQCGHGRDVR